MYGELSFDPDHASSPHNSNAAQTGSFPLLVTESIIYIMSALREMPLLWLTHLYRFLRLPQCALLGLQLDGLA
ncbi:hypothetical protein JOF28_000443 [Leucobacter exalbidus]|uniref:Uncharacterized protein n=1 Tax=Leucobacter exalbidus TaxID=662960 RepID=A0A940PVZ0_9MICO|nr:hypothetical protein [Leucobacter exalbidus]